MLMCIFCTFNAVFANVSADKTVTIKSENISVKEALNMVKKQTGINIMYEDATLNNVPLKLTLNKEPLEQALSVICSQAGMRYELVENNYVLILPIDRNAKRRTITGVIKDDTGEPVHWSFYCHPRYNFRYCSQYGWAVHVVLSRKY